MAEPIEVTKEEVREIEKIKGGVIRIGDTTMEQINGDQSKIDEIIDLLNSHERELRELRKH